MFNPRLRYEKRINSFNRLLNKQLRSAAILSNLRMFFSLSGLAGSIYLFKTGKYLVGSILLTLTIIMFIYLVIKHERLTTNTAYTKNLQEINKIALKRLDGSWKEFQDTGAGFRETNHRFSGDLDIFGHGSLFQWINSTSTFDGRRKLVQFLTEPIKSKTGVLERQEALRELSINTAWTQRFISEGIIVSKKHISTEFLVSWALKRNGAYSQKWLKAAVRVAPIITITLLYMSMALSNWYYYLSIPAVMLQGLALLLSGKERSKALSAVFLYEENVKTFFRMLKRFEKKKFTSVLLKDLQASLVNSQNEHASRQIKRLSKIVDLISNRNNAVFTIINILTLWDYQCMISLERWKEKSGTSLEKWLDVIGDIEALISLSNISSNNPNWVFPEIADDKSLLLANSMGHPLLSEDRVYNDLHIEQPAGILLITGSNMSGKSTLLRTAGLNLILAYMGCPVCAELFRCSIMDVYTCMRVSDNLTENTSSFYAELLRIKMIINAAKESDQIFFLLDEIFKGTNSQDRHTGAKIVIRYLAGKGALGLVSTHDLELSELEKETAGGIKNFHFTEDYVNNEIRFDYKLRPGVSTTRNALYLIKMAGIESDN